MTVADLDALGARLSGLVDAMRLHFAFDAVRVELSAAFHLGGLVFVSHAPRPRSEAWRAEWNDIAAEVARYLGAIDNDASPRSHAARVARARLRRWDHHTSCVDLAREAAVAPGAQP